MGGHLQDEVTEDHDCCLAGPLSLAPFDEAASCVVSDGEDSMARNWGWPPIDSQ